MFKREAQHSDITFVISLNVTCYSGVYWICASHNCTDSRELFCDMRSGGWTLIGQIGGVAANIYDKWLVTNENTGILRSPVIQAGTYGCIYSVDLAVNYAHEVRFFLVIHTI